MMRTDSLMKVLLAALSIYELSDNPFDRAILAIVGRYSEHTIHLFTLAPNLFLSNWIEFLNKPVSLNATSPRQQWRTDIYLVLSQDEQSVVHFLENSSSSFRKDTPWVIGFNCDVKSNNLSKVFQTFFNRGILNVVAVTLEKSYPHVHAYKPFRSRTNVEDCYNYHPVMTDVWDSQNSFSLSELFSENKVDNMHNCLVKMFIFPLHPYIWHSGNDTANPLHGTAVMLVQALREKMNFTPAFSTVSNYTRGINEIKTSPAVLAFGTPGHDFELDHGTLFGAKCYSWCMPTFVSHMRGWKALTNTFDSNVWLACIGSVMIAVVVIKFLLRFSYHDSRMRSYPSWLVVCSIVLEVPYYSPPKNTLGFFPLTFCIAFLVISTAFKARLHVLMCSVPSASKVSTLAQVYNGKLDLFVPSGSKWMLQTVQNENFYNSRVHFYDRSDPQSASMVTESLNEGTSAILVSDSYCFGFAKKFGKTSEGYNKVYSVPECVVNVASASFGISHDSPFRERLKKLTSAMWESGMSDKYLSLALPPEVFSSGNVVISFKDVLSVFLVFFGGLALSVTTFVAEIVLRGMSAR